MKRFDAEAISTRLMDRMRVNLDWALLSQNGVIAAIMDAFADRLSEVSRYAEYLLAEKKWTTAQNISSLNAQTGLIGRKSHRMKSAISYVIVSHTDESGVNRLANFGRTFFNLDDRSNYDNITKDSDPQDQLRTQALTPWTYDVPYIIPFGTRFISASGTEFVATEAVASRALKEPYDVIAGNTDRYDAFLSAGGWSGIKYLKIPVIQGKVKSTTIGTAQGARFEAMILPVANCEDATNSVSEKFLKFLVNPTPLVPDNAEEWVQVPNILLAGPLDKVYEVINMPDYSGVIFKVGDGINGQKLPVGASVTAHYLETIGTDGNIDKKYQINTIAFPSGLQMIDPRTNTESTFLSVTNDNPILGGSIAEDEETLRLNAPLDYLQYYAIATTEAYENQIKQYAQIGLDKVKVFAGDTEDMLTLIGDTSSTSRGPIVTGTSQSVLYVTAISSNGGIIDNAQDAFVTPVAQAIGNLKAPSDSLVYIEPTFIQLCLNTTVYSNSTDQSDQDIINTETAAISDAYSIYNMDFKTPFYSSEYISLTQSFPFVNYTDTFVEAVADMPLTVDNIDQVPTVDTTGTYPTLYKINFKFNSIFGKSPYAQGFKNHKQGSPYLLRIDLKFINDPTAAATKNRTFFIFDDRSLYEPTATALQNGAPYQDDLDFETAKYYDQVGRRIVTNGAPYTPWVRPEETLEDFNTRAARVSQYAYISRITDATYIASARDFTKGPFEIRPYIVDSQGKNAVYTIADVTWPANEQSPVVPLPGGVQCYKRDWRYIDFLDISFMENYDQPDSDIFATGALVIPADYFGFTNIDIANEEQFVGSLKNFCSIKAYAMPLLTDLEPQNWNEIIFVATDDIIVERLRPSTT